MTGPNQNPAAGRREFNRQRVLTALAAGADTADGGRTRAELGRVTGLARSTVTDLVAELLAVGRIVEVDEGPASGRRAGRPSHRLVLTPSAALAIGIDFGHSHCRTGVVDGSGRVLAVRSFTLDVDSSPAASLHRAREMVGALLRTLGADRHRVVGAAVGLPAPVDTTRGTVGAGNVLPKWVHLRPGAELQAELGFPVLVENDANLGVLGEAAWGAARGFRDVIYVKAATGIGAGMILGGQLHRGATGRAGEIGHVPVDTAGAVCRCGNRGCLETVASATQVLAMLQPAHSEPLTLQRLVELVQAGDPGAHRVLADAGRTIGRVLADMVNSLNPGVVVLGGELATAGEPILRGLRESLERFAQPEIACAVRVRLGELGQDAQLVGAGSLVLATAG